MKHYSLYRIIKWSGIAYILFNIFYLIKFHGGFSNSSSDFADYGNFIGGAVGPLFTAIMIYIAIETLFSQQKNFEIQNQIYLRDKNIALLLNQIENHLKELNLLLQSEIGLKDLYNFLKKNNKVAITFFSFDNSKVNNFDEFREKNYYKAEFNIINFLNTLNQKKKIINIHMTELKIPHNINYKIEMVKFELNHIAFLISDLVSKYGFSHKNLKIICGKVFSINHMLKELNFYNSEEDTYLFEFYNSIETDSHGEQLVLDKLQYLEVKEKILKYMESENMLEKNLSFELFIVQFDFLEDGENIVLKDKYSDSKYIVPLKSIV